MWKKPTNIKIPKEIMEIISNFFNMTHENNLEAVRDIITQYPGVVNYSYDSDSLLNFKHDRTPLNLALKMGHAEIARLLIIEGGADVNAKDNNGTTPLLRAAYTGHTESAKLLVEKGALLCMAQKQVKKVDWRGIKDLISSLDFTGVTITVENKKILEEQGITSLEKAVVISGFGDICGYFSKKYQEANTDKIEQARLYPQIWVMLGAPLPNLRKEINNGISNTLQLGRTAKFFYREANEFIGKELSFIKNNLPTLPQPSGKGGQEESPLRILPQEILFGIYKNLFCVKITPKELDGFNSAYKSCKAAYEESGKQPPAVASSMKLAEARQGRSCSIQ